MAATQPYRVPTIYESTATGMPALRPYLAELKSRRRFIWHLARGARSAAPLWSWDRSVARVLEAASAAAR